MFFFIVFFFFAVAEDFVFFFPRANTLCFCNHFLFKINKDLRLSTLYKNKRIFPAKDFNL